MDGNTKDPITTGGPIGLSSKALPENIAKNKTPIIVFIKIKTNVDKTVDYSIFNGREDIMAMVDFCIGIESGNIPQKYHKKKPPIINNSRLVVTIIKNQTLKILIDILRYTGITSCIFYY